MNAVSETVIKMIVESRMKFSPIVKGRLSRKNFMKALVGPFWTLRRSLLG